MSGVVVPFPSRARPRVVRPAHVPAREEAEYVAWEDGDGSWMVDIWSGSQDSVCFVGRFKTHAEALAFMAAHPVPQGPAPRGAA